MAVVKCPSCGQELNVPAELAGKKVRCSKCASTFTTIAPSTSGRPPAAPSRPPNPNDFDDADDDDADDRPRRKRSRGKPHRGGMIMAFGIVSIVLFLTSLGGFVGVGPFAVPLNLVGLVLGILAWIWGGADLNQMKSGEMDKRGQSNTQAGYICGIVGTILHGLGMVCGCVAIIFFASILGLAWSTAP